MAHWQTGKRIKSLIVGSDRLADPRLRIRHRNRRPRNDRPGLIRQSSRNASAHAGPNGSRAKRDQRESQREANPPQFRTIQSVIPRGSSHAKFSCGGGFISGPMWLWVVTRNLSSAHEPQSATTSQLRNEKIRRRSSARPCGTACKIRPLPIASRESEIHSAPPSPLSISQKTRSHTP